MGYKPKRTIRCVLFSNEENGLRGGTEYAAQAKGKGEKHIAALESDSGGFTPRGFNFEGHPDIFVDKFKKTAAFVDILAPYGLSFNPGGSGADISPLKEQKTLLIGFQPDLHRYFDYHHAETDVFSAVNQRELEMGAASMTALIFLIDKYGL
jgi:Zn-dependent M28 family amino/carboxypeptidase